jgi:ATP-binding cassette subfamily C protein LapB
MTSTISRELQSEDRNQLLVRLQQSDSYNSQLLVTLLAALEWDGELVQLRNALAGKPEGLDETDLLNTLYNLGYRWKVNSLRASTYDELESGPFPLLLQFEQRKGENLKLVEKDSDLPRLDRFKGRILVYRFSLLNTEVKGKAPEQWFQAQLLRFRSRIGQLYLISLFINLLALVPPFYIRSVYNQGIPSGESLNIFLLLPFTLAAVALQIWLSARRQNKLNTLAAQLDMVISTRVMERMLRLRLPQLERFTPLSLTKRLRGYYSLRQFITGPFAMAVLDLPYVALYLGALAAISVTLSALTLVLVVMCMGGVCVVSWFGNAVQKPLQQGRSDYEPLLMELLQKLPEIKNSGAERLWSARLEGASAAAIRQTLGGLRVQELTNILTSEFSQLTGALVLAAGAALALRGEGLELGTLLAAMFFVWRTFRPIQMLFQALNRWELVGPSLSQLNRFMASPEGEMDSAQTQAWILPKPQGEIELRNVSLKLNDLQDPSLSGINLKIRKGQFVAVTGSEGSGRSALLKLLQGQYKPSSGQILMDGADSRQFPIGELRAAVCYLSADPEVLPGSLRENLMLGNPNVDDATLISICKALGLHGLLEGPGLDRTFTGGHQQRNLPSHLAYGIGLARVLLSEPNVMLLDSPFAVLRPEQAHALLDLLTAMRGTVTSVIVTDDPDVIAKADQVVVLKGGTLVFQGSPAELVGSQATPP